ncbi:response regulator [Patescibacteria group bacterium]|nr:response regulator [Patescibacteria group bacterium]
MSPIICVDDQMGIMQDRYTAICEFLGGKCLYFENPEKALEEIKKGVEVELVISDFTLPEMNGNELIEKIKKFNPEIKCVIFSASPPAQSPADAVFQKASGDRLKEIAEEIKKMLN